MQYDTHIQWALSLHFPTLDWRIYKALLWQESRFNAQAVSPVGAQGIAQFMPATWAEWAPKAGMAGKRPYDAEASIITGACYLAHLYGSWHSPRPDIDRICLMLASYNAGLGNLLKAQKKVGGKLLYKEIIQGLPEVTGKHSKETIDYVQKILSYYFHSVIG